MSGEHRPRADLAWTSEVGETHGCGVDDEIGERRHQVKSVHGVEEPRSVARLTANPVLPDDLVGVWVDHDYAVVVVVGEEDVAVWEWCCERGVVEWRAAGAGPVAPVQAPAAVERFESARAGVVDVR